MNNKKPAAYYLDNLIIRGRHYFTLKTLADEASVKETSLSVSLSRLAKKGKVKMIRNGFGIITEYSQGSIDPSYFIHAMMEHMNSRYYVGLLSAASYWGASHQSAMTYYVFAEKVIKPIKLGAMRIEFITKSNFDQVKEVKKVSGVGGYYYVSTPELTAIDLIRFPKKSGHLSNIATILEDLVEKIDFKKLQLLCKKESTTISTIQRLGFILDNVLGYSKQTSQIENILTTRKANRILLSVVKKNDKKNFSKFPFSEKWKVYQNTTIEPD